MTDTTYIRIIVLLSASLGLGACGGEEATPADSISTSGDEDPSDPSASTNPTSATLSDTSADTTAEETTDDPATTDDPSTTDDPTTGGPECLGENDCWQCEPQNNEHVINGCTDAACEPFANERRLPLLEPDGSLPPLP